MITADQTSTFPRFLDLSYPSVERGEGVRLWTADGAELLDACSGGAMVSNLGHGLRDVVDAGVLQAEKIAYNKDIPYSGPMYDSMTVEGNAIRDTREQPQRMQTVGILIEERVGSVRLDRNQIETGVPIEDRRQGHVRAGSPE